MLRPLPPFRAEPLKKPLVPKPGVRKDGTESISIKASRLPVRVARQNGAPSLRVLGRAAPDDHA
ncbi:hypothetical protein [Hyphomicrobium sp. CS1GBMeth3]|uniref:hypothetical protein n=1 Tax=Hyphomicrobium sp. CS1GBMeth3 TaxID=1892845 RepID=UPI0009301D13|nr:hypothetical protein [Hyphomicrobium sp. CS1GBMeth3]